MQLQCPNTGGTIRRKAVRHQDSIEKIQGLNQKTDLEIEKKIYHDKWGTYLQNIPHKPNHCFVGVLFYTKFI